MTSSPDAAPTPPPAPAPPAPVPGGWSGVPVEVPGYRTTGLLGTGASSTVWAATDRATGAEVALKLVHGDDAHRARVRREGAVLQRVDSPHVVRLLSILDVPDRGVVLVLERARGGTLHDLLRARGPLSAAEVVTVVAPLASALADLHARGLVHGDVSPGNVLLTAQGRPVLADLAGAGITGEAPTEVSGTPGFVDPAVLAGALPGPESDVYALAAVGWWAWTGLPVTGSPDGPYPDVAGEHPPALAAALRAGLDPDPARRPAAAVLAADVFAAAAARPLRLPVPGCAPGADRDSSAGSPSAGGAPDVSPDAAWALDGGRAAARGRDVAALTHRIRSQAAVALPVQDAEHEEKPASALLRRTAAVVLSAALLAGVAVGAWFGALPRETAPQGQPPGSAGADADPAAHGGAAVRVSDDATPSARSAAGVGPTPPAAGDPSVPAAGPTVPAAGPMVPAADAGGPASFADVVAALADQRARAFSTGLPGPLSQVNVAGSAAAAADEATARRLREAGVVLAGLEFEVRAVRAHDRSADEAAVEVTVATSAHRQVGRDGAVLAEVAAQPPRTSTLLLRRVDGAWRVEQVR